MDPAQSPMPLMKLPLEYAKQQPHPWRRNTINPKEQP